MLAMALCHAFLANALRWIFFKLLSISSYHMQIAQILRAPYRSRFLLRRSYRRKGVNSLFFMLLVAWWICFLATQSCHFVPKNCCVTREKQVVHVPGEDREKQLAKFLGDQDRMLGRWHFRETNSKLISLGGGFTYFFVFTPKIGEIV